MEPYQHSGSVTFASYLIEFDREGTSRKELRAWIEPASSTGAPVEGILIMFTEKRPDLGYYNPDNKWMVQFALPSEYTDICALIRAGGTKTIDWTSGRDDRLLSFDLSEGDAAMVKRIRQAETEITKLGTVAQLLVDV